MRRRSHQLLRRSKRSLRRHSRRRDARHRLNAIGDDATLGTGPTTLGDDETTAVGSPAAGAPVGRDEALP